MSFCKFKIFRKLFNFISICKYYFPKPLLRKLILIKPCLRNFWSSRWREISKSVVIPKHKKSDADGRYAACSETPGCPRGGVTQYLGNLTLTSRGLVARLSIKGCLPVCYSFSLNFDRVSISILMPQRKKKCSAFYRIHSKQTAERKSQAPHIKHESSLYRGYQQTCPPAGCLSWDPEGSQQNKNKNKTKGSSVGFLQWVHNRVGMRR